MGGLIISLIVYDPWKEGKGSRVDRGPPYGSKDAWTGVFSSGTYIGIQGSWKSYKQAKRLLFTHCINLEEECKR